MTKIRKCVGLLVVAALLIVGLLVAFPVSALAINPPDTAPAVNKVTVYNLDDGGMGVLADYYLDYTTLPAETTTDAYRAVFIDTDGATQLKATAPYTFQTSGYGRGQVWLRFTAAEVSTYSIDSADVALYKVWLVGNPTLTWNGTIPKTIVTIDTWHTTGDPKVRLRNDVLNYADALELAWGLDMIQSTPLGNKLTTVGESYYTNVIPSLTTLAPAVFAAGTVIPSLEPLDYSTSFGATANGTIVVGTPQTLVAGTNTVTTTGTGVFTITLTNGTSGNITNGVLGVVPHSPSDLVAGVNQVVVTVLGDLTVVVNLVNTQTKITQTVEGTGFDLTTVAADFGMSRLVFSGLVWMFITIILCAATYKASHKANAYGEDESSGKMVMLVFGISLIGGTLLGLLDMRVTALLAIGYAMFIGYVLFLRNSGGDIGKTVMFMAFVWFITCLMGGLIEGSISGAATQLTANITATDTTIPVVSTNGFKTPVTIVIGDERIIAPSSDNTNFYGTWWQPLARGVEDTTKATHPVGAAVRTVENSMLNNAISYNIAQISDSSGIMQFFAVGKATVDILLNLIVLPISFLGTDMVILTILWGIIGLGLVISIFISMAGGRRV